MIILLHFYESKHKTAIGFYFVSSVAKRCIPNNIKELIDVAKENNVDLNNVFNSTDVDGFLSNVMNYLNEITDWEMVSYER